MDKVLMMMYYWCHDVKATHVMLFEGISSWHNMVNYNNFFGVECFTRLNTQNAALGSFNGNGLPM